MAIQIKVDRNTYTSIAQAWRHEAAEGLPLITVRWRLKQGWDTRDAFWYPPVPPKDRRKFKRLARIKGEKKQTM